MPKKKTKKKGTKKKGTAKKGSKASSKTPGVSAVQAGPTDVEISLRLELESVEQELARVRHEAERARRQNGELRQELERVDQESHEYEAYMKQWVNREKTHLEGLVERQQRELDAIEADKQQIATDAEMRRKAFRDQLFEQEHELGKIEHQISELSEFETRRTNQLAEIERLEKEIEALRRNHDEEMDRLKTEHFREKMTFQDRARDTVQQLEEDAARHALEALELQTTTVKGENRSLRKRLLDTIAANKVLRKHEQRLVEHQQDLQRLVDMQLGLDETKAKEVRTSLTRRPSLPPLQSQASLSLTATTMFKR